MKRYIISLNWENKYFEKDNNTQSTDSVQSISIYQCIFSRTITNKFTIFMETQRPQKPNTILRKKNGLEESSFLISDYTTKL